MALPSLAQQTAGSGEPGLGGPALGPRAALLSCLLAALLTLALSASPSLPSWAGRTRAVPRPQVPESAAATEPRPPGAELGGGGGAGGGEGGARRARSPQMRNREGEDGEASLELRCRRCWKLLPPSCQLLPH